jgi:YihY family inner membrane protein
MQKFFADRGTHLAAMIAYFALVSFVPLVFIALSLLGLAHRADASDFLVQELERAFPTTSPQSILTLVHRVQDNATTLGVVGAALLAWTSLSLFSALESTLNIVYGRPNRSFLRGKGLAAAMMIGGLVVLFVGLLIGAVGVELLKRYAPGIGESSTFAYALSIAVSLLGVFVFLLVSYRLLPNADVDLREALPGALAASIVLEASFQVLPVYARLASVNPTLRVLGGPVILLLWLYVMANVIVFGAEINWWQARRREARTAVNPLSPPAPAAAPAPPAPGASTAASSRPRARPRSVPRRRE